MADGKEEVSDTEAGLDGAPPSFKVEVPEEPDQALTMRLIRKCCASKWTAGSDRCVVPVVVTASSHSRLCVFCVVT